MTHVPSLMSSPSQWSKNAAAYNAFNEFTTRLAEGVLQHVFETRKKDLPWLFLEDQREDMGHVKVLDVACGKGAMLEAFHNSLSSSPEANTLSSKIEIYCTDISTAMIEGLRGRLSYRRQDLLQEAASTSRGRGETSVVLDGTKPLHHRFTAPIHTFAADGEALDAFVHSSSRPLPLPEGRGDDDLTAPSPPQTTAVIPDQYDLVTNLFGLNFFCDPLRGIQEMSKLTRRRRRTSLSVEEETGERGGGESNSSSSYSHRASTGLPGLAVIATYAQLDNFELLNQCARDLGVLKDEGGEAKSLPTVAKLQRYSTPDEIIFEMHRVGFENIQVDSPSCARVTQRFKATDYALLMASNPTAAPLGLTPETALAWLQKHWRKCDGESVWIDGAALVISATRGV